MTLAQYVAALFASIAAMERIHGRWDGEQFVPWEDQPWTAAGKGAKT